MTSLRWMDSSDNITKIVGQSCVHCKPLCCPPTLLTLPLKIRVPPANATHIIILQLLNILITSYGKYKYCPTHIIQHSSTMHALLQHSSTTMHALLQHSSTMHALLVQHSSTHVHYFLLHVSHSDLISKEFINGVTVFNFLISPLKLQL